jgi:uncharacterized protein YndB with AHSA1/START domain
MTNVQQGCLVLGDITGYSKYLAGVELEHSHDVLADLMNVLVAQMRGLLHLAKLEGDAVFCYEHEGEADGSTLMAMIASSYSAFAMRLQLIERHTTCECNACRLIPQLNLKFLVHHGQFVIHEVAGSRELVGRDVILVHRMLKSSFTQRTGIRGYAMITEACAARFGLNPGPLGMVPHLETFEDVGEVRSYMLDLETQWKQEQERRTIYIAPGEGVTMMEAELPAPPAIVWHFLTAPQRRMQWQPDTLRVEEVTHAGARGVGTTNHCVHGDSLVEEEVLDWKPFRYFSHRAKGSFGTIQFTTELVPVPDGTATRVSWRMLPEGGAAALERFRPMAAGFQEWYRLSVASMRRLLQSVKDEAAERLETTVDS